MRPRLVTIPLSHYCERARWGLDHAEIDYDEDQHLQFFATKAVRKLGGRRTVPVLLTADGRLFDSADILRWADARSREPLYPDGPERSRIEALDRELAADYGVEARRLAYAWFFRNIATTLPFNMGAAPSWQVTALRAGRRFVQPSIERYIGLDAAQLVRARDLVMRQLDRVAERLGDGRPFLGGDRFSAADLTFAALSAVLVLPERYGVPLPKPDALDADARALVTTVREHPAGRHALAMYERRPPVRAEYARPLRRP